MLKNQDERDPMYGKTSAAHELFGTTPAIVSLAEMDDREATLLYASGTNIQYSMSQNTFSLATLSYLVI
jgi:hypothetical protein